MNNDDVLWVCDICHKTIAHPPPCKRHAREHDPFSGVKLRCSGIVAFIALAILAFAAVGCAPLRVLFVPSPCHPAELLPNGDGFIVYPDPCDAVRRP